MNITKNLLDSLDGHCSVFKIIVWFWIKLVNLLEISYVVEIFVFVRIHNRYSHNWQLVHINWMETFQVEAIEVALDDVNNAKKDDEGRS